MKKCITRLKEIPLLGNINPIINFSLIWLFLSSTVLMSSAYKIAFCNSIMQFQTTDYLVEHLYGLATVAQILGLLINGIITKIFNDRKKQLLVIIFFTLAMSILLFVIRYEFIPYIIATLFFLFGLLISLSIDIFLINTSASKRIVILSAVLIANSCFSFILKSFDTLDFSTICLINFCIILITSFFSINLHFIPSKTDNGINRFGKKDSFMPFVSIMIYFSAISLVKGLLLQGTYPRINAQIPNFYFILTISYIISLVIILLSVKKDHLGIVVYIANSLIMLSLLLLFVAGNSPAHYLISCVLIGVALGINDVFCFDTLFDVSCRMCNSQIIIGLGFGVRVLFIFLGIVIAGQYQETETIQSNLLIVLFSIIATMVLPFLRVAITRISPDSVFRINPIELKHNDTFVGLNTSPEVSLHIDQSLPVSDFSYLSCLSKRENEVLALVLKGYPNDLISSSLFISNNTLKKHLQSIYSKLGVHSRAELFKLLLDRQH